MERWENYEFYFDNNNNYISCKVYFKSNNTEKSVMPEKYKILLNLPSTIRNGDIIFNELFSQR